MAQRHRSSRSGSGRSRSQGGARSSSTRSGSTRGGSTRGGSTRGGSTRGGYRQPAKKGGGAGPIILAIVLVIGAVGLIVVLSSGGDDKDRDRAAAPASSSTTPARHEPEEEKPPAYPPITQHIRDKAKGIADQASVLKKQGEEVYQEAMKARRDGDQDLWQQKLGEASEFFLEIQDLYNELIGEMPSNDHYSEEDVANYYLGREAEIVMQATRRLADIKKQRRM